MGAMVRAARGGPCERMEMRKATNNPCQPLYGDGERNRTGRGRDRGARKNGLQLPAGRGGALVAATGPHIHGPGSVVGGDHAPSAWGVA